MYAIRSYYGDYMGLFDRIQTKDSKPTPAIAKKTNNSENVSEPSNLFDTAEKEKPEIKVGFSVAERVKKEPVDEFTKRNNFV